MTQDLPHTKQSLITDLQACGVREGHTLIVHSSLRQIGYVIGGAQAVVEALLEVVGISGTLVVPTQSWRNLDPVRGVHTWHGQPVPQAWWPMIREHYPAFNPDLTPSLNMGAIAEMIRTHPKALRSSHPARSFAALGANAEMITSSQTLTESMGAGSPLAQLYALDGCILLLGVGHDSNTSLHLAEHRADYPGKKMLTEHSAVMVDGRREWLEYEVLEPISDDFVALGADFERADDIPVYTVGNAQARYIKQSEMVDFAVRWFEEHRG